MRKSVANLEIENKKLKLNASLISLNSQNKNIKINTSINFQIISKEKETKIQNFTNSNLELIDSCSQIDYNRKKSNEEVFIEELGKIMNLPEVLEDKKKNY